MLSLITYPVDISSIMINTYIMIFIAIKEHSNFVLNILLIICKNILLIIVLIYVNIIVNLYYIAININKY